MRIAIAANHTAPHCGGSEKVVQLISESMVNRFSHQVYVFSKSLTQKKLEQNGVQYIKMPMEFSKFASRINDLSIDSLLVYSDYFHYWREIVLNNHQLKCKKSIALVGMNGMRENPGIMKAFAPKHTDFRVITHSDNYIDYKQCQSMHIPVTVIPNGINLKEFESSQVDFVQKYDIGDKKIILCVSNFFPGKGQEHLIKALARLKSQRDDFVAIFISTTVNFFLAQHLSKECHRSLKALKVPHRFLVDIDRQDVIAAFKAAYAFAFPTQKEVAPMVVLECMASKLPWMAMPVGNVQQLKGGMLVPFRGTDKKGFLIYGSESYDTLIRHMNTLLDNPDMRNRLGDEGYQQVKSDYNWDHIAELYNEFFEHDRTNS